MDSDHDNVRLENEILRAKLVVTMRAFGNYSAAALLTLSGYMIRL